MSIDLVVNGIPYEVDLNGLPADMTLNTFIREYVGLSGTKFMCLEGGCGVCVCVVKGRHPVSGEEHTWSVNSCLTLLNVCDGWDITTIEGIGNKSNGYHPIQKKLAELYGSQCGYCSPGVVMNMYGLLKSKNGKVTMKEVENSFGGNICRCTGYRPILDAMKTFAVDSPTPVECRDIEDLGSPCPKTGQQCGGLCKKPPKSYDNGITWFWPKTLPELSNIISGFSNDKYILVAGNTGHGVYRRSPDVTHFVDVSHVAILHSHTITSSGITLGANLSLTEAMEIFINAAKIPGFEYCQELYNHFDLIANVPVRNMGTLAGNLMLKHAHPEFISDVFITFNALNVMVKLARRFTPEVLTMTEFLKANMRKRIITGFMLKPYPKDKFIFRSYKIMQRAQNDHAYVNSAFLFEMSSINGLVASARICFGGINPKFVHARATENFLKGKPLFSYYVIQDMFAKLKLELNPDTVDIAASVEYRKLLACGLFYKFLLSIVPAQLMPDCLKSGGQLLKRPLSSGRQTFAYNPDILPVSAPPKKLEALIQCSGEARYMNDLPSQPRQVWCDFVYATKVGVEIIHIDASGALIMPGVVAFYSAKDIPGKNSFVSTKGFSITSDEEIFCSGKVLYFNQPLGMIVAESRALATYAASKVVITYREGNPKVYATMKDVIEANLVDRIIDVLVSPQGDLQFGSEVRISGSGSLSLGQQYHFTMEPHTAVVVPIDGRLEVYSSTQWMDITQIVISDCLQLKMNDVHLNVRRIGGGFGTKISRSGLVACAAALAAVKLNRTARFVQTIESMMGSIGKRWAIFTKYDFHTSSNGRVIGINCVVFEDSGCTASESPIELFVGPAMKNCYNFSDKLKINAKIVLTDTPSNTYFRAPGTLEGFAMIETIMEHIAFETGLDPIDVRLRNIAPNHKIRGLLQSFIKTSEYRERRDEIDFFNQENRWRKRGIGISLMQYQIQHFGTHSATVAIYRADGTVMVSHGGIEMGQGLNTKAAEVVAFALGIHLEMVHIDSSNTVNGANTFFTGGSIGSECICVAVRKACDTLLSRLRPVRESMGNPTWPALIEQAHLLGVNLIASDWFQATDLQPYLIFGMALTEVEIDILTGNHLIKRVDILEDAGNSINPSVDVGQIEGAFVMGLGYFLTEQLIYDRDTGKLLTDRTWNYKPPGCKDIPIDFRIELLQNSPNPGGFMRSKATGEPAICLAVSAVFAIQHALQSAREDADLEIRWVSLGAPTTPEDVLLNAGVDVDQFHL